MYQYTKIDPQFRRELAAHITEKGVKAASNLDALYAALNEYEITGDVPLLIEAAYHLLNEYVEHKYVENVTINKIEPDKNVETMTINNESNENVIEEVDTTNMGGETLADKVRDLMKRFSLR